MRNTAVFALISLLGVACGPAPAPVEPSQPSTSAEPSVAPPPAPSGSASASAPSSAVEIPPAIAAVVAAPDRSEDDRALDAGRHPAEMLAFFGIKSGQKVADLAAGFGYTTELLARTVGPEGKVYGQNNKFVLERFAEKGWAARVAKPVNKIIVRVDREFDEPLPPDVRDLDAVIMILFYHDTVWQKADRDKMNKAIFNSLKSGGVFGIIDHSARDGDGVKEVETLHRIEEKVVRAEVEKAGFKLAASADFLKSPSDQRDWNASPRAAADRRGTSDRFVLKFVKP